jgi:uroporphyrinogen decarboxylase
MNAKENFLEAIHFGRPEYVPLGNEDIQISMSFNFTRQATNVDGLDCEMDTWGIGWVAEHESAAFPKINPLADIRKLRHYEFPDPKILTLSDKTLAKRDAAKKEGKLVYGGMGYLLFERVWALTGMDTFFMGLYDHPEELRFLLHKIAEYARGVFDRYLEMGVDGVVFSEDLGSQKALMMSPAQFREFLLPEYHFIFENLLREKKIIHFHSCGCVDAIAGDLADAGVTMLNPIQANANDLAKVKRDTFGKTALNGGISTHLILTGTPGQVYEETKRVVNLLKPGGGYVVAPDQGFKDRPVENINARWQAARDFGRY